MRWTERHALTRSQQFQSFHSSDELDLIGLAADAAPRSFNPCGGVGAETSCRRCLRVLRSERYHEQLRRGVAADVLGRLLGSGPDRAPLGTLRVPPSDVGPLLEG
ncbi:hypothetical protein [Dactylosporangium sp. NPDC049140]|uniref:hypothetical protein n=1 Tax=Dactylosporangium sp. NPDC049140 TaxID=3155647 RepID=UPI0033D8144C